MTRPVPWVPPTWESLPDHELVTMDGVRPWYQRTVAHFGLFTSRSRLVLLAVALEKYQGKRAPCPGDEKLARFCGLNVDGVRRARADLITPRRASDLPRPTARAWTKLYPDLAARPTLVPAPLRILSPGAEGRRIQYGNGLPDELPPGAQLVEPPAAAPAVELLNYLPRYGLPHSHRLILTMLCTLARDGVHVTITKSSLAQLAGVDRHTVDAALGTMGTARAEGRPGTLTHPGTFTAGAALHERPALVEIVHPATQNEAGVWSLAPLAAAVGRAVDNRPVVVQSDVQSDVQTVVQSDVQTDVVELHTYLDLDRDRNLDLDRTSATTDRARDERRDADAPRVVGDES